MKLEVGLKELGHKIEFKFLDKMKSSKPIPVQKKHYSLLDFEAVPVKSNCSCHFSSG